MWASTALAQKGVVGGVVKDENGQSIKGATVRGQNPDATPGSFTTTTDDKGRFAVIGLRTGQWTIVAEAPGFHPDAARMQVQGYRDNPQVKFALKKDTGIPSVGALAGISAKDLQGDLAAADQLFTGQQWDQSIVAYKAILSKTPALSSINLQIAAAYRNKKDYDHALVAYNDLLKTDPGSDKATAGIGMTNFEKGDMRAAEDGLRKAAESPDATRETLFGLGEVKLAQGQSGEAAEWYQKAADIDPGWAKPWFKLGLVALNRGDKGGAAKMMEKVMTVDPMSPEAAQAQTVIDQVK